MNKTCASCGAPLAEGAKFCMKCGAPVSVEASSPSFCPNCGEKVQAGAQFCSKCGQSVEEYAPANAVRLEDLPKPQPGFFGFQGRMGRAQYANILFLLFVLQCLGAYFLFVADFSTTSLVLTSPFYIIAFASNFSGVVRRLHDLNYDGLLALLNFVPFVNVGFCIYLLFAKGVKGTNKYGLDPLEYKPESHT